MPDDPIAARRPIVEKAVTRAFMACTGVLEISGPALTIACAFGVALERAPFPRPAFGTGRRS